jgi:hypothetical protein
VEAQSGQRFSICCSVSTWHNFQSAAIRFRAYIDGQKINARIVKRIDCGPTGIEEAISGAIVGSFKTRPFVFSDLIVGTSEQASLSLWH